MKKILLAIGFFVALNTEAQVVNKFRDSSVFFKGVRFDSTLVFKGLKAGSTADTNVVVISSTGKASKISKSAFLGDLPIYSISDSNTVINYDVLNSQNTPPVSPSTGDVYLVGTVPTGAWVGHAKDIAEWNGSEWVFTDGVQGDFLYNATTALTYIFRSGNWVQTTGIPALNNGNTISSGLRIGTNNARSLTFETNNVNRGRFDSIGRFYIYDTSLRKSNKYLQIDSITGRLIASEVSGGEDLIAQINAIEPKIEDGSLIVDETIIPTNEGGLYYAVLKYKLIGSSDVDVTISGNDQFNTILDFSNTTVAGNREQNTNCRVTDCTFGENFELNTSSIFLNSDFGDRVKDVTVTSFINTSVAGKVDRLINCQILNGTTITSNIFGGRLDWSSSLFVSGVEIDSSVAGLNNVSLIETTANCFVKYITGISNHGQSFGFQNCVITATSPANTFGNITISTLLNGVTIDEASYPELFDISIHKEIYAKPNGDKWYRYYDNSNVLQFVQIL